MTAAPRPPLFLSLSWDDELRFTADSDHAQMVFDGNAQAGPSPMQALAGALAGCMAIDVLSILQKGHHVVRSLDVALTAARADGTPTRFTAVDLRFRISGEVTPEAIERAIDLSRDRYCAVWHTLRQDLTLSTSFEVSAQA